MAVRIGMVVLVLAVVAGGLGGPAAHAATFRGTIVDAETREPLEGTVIVVIWWRSPYVPRVGGGFIPYKVVEGVAGAGGRFAVDVSAGLLAVGAFERRQVFVYKPGYHLLTGGTKDRSARLFDDVTVQLAKVKTVQDARKYFSVTDIDIRTCLPSDPDEWCVAEARIPHLLRAIAIQRKIYEGYPAGLFTVEDDR